MNGRGPALLLAGVLGLALGAAAVSGTGPSPRRQAEAAEFQRLVGGLGLGPAADLSQCPFAFDPRICPACPWDSGPVPGGVYFCPQHACSVLFYPPLAGGRDAPEETGRHARVP